MITSALNVDWQAIVIRLGRSRIDFKLSEWDDDIRDVIVIRLTCNCCGAWAEDRIAYEALERAYYPYLVIADSIERLTRFMLGVNTYEVMRLPNMSNVRELPS